ncbi:MAG: hypothetical protein INR62_12480 [Rhodospirillales bacterium]|nr:hypothetical protein [Acetobacter sp.]
MFNLEVDQPWQYFSAAARALASTDQGPALQAAGSEDVRIREQMEEQGSAGEIDAPHFAFTINWNRSDNQLALEFLRWLQNTRPFVPREDRGNTTGNRLKMLRAMRLLHHHPYAEAADLTVSALGSPLYGKRPSWERAREGALKAYRAYFLDDWSRAGERMTPRSFAKFKRAAANLRAG